jgi:hypothetical protein
VQGKASQAYQTASAQAQVGLWSFALSPTQPVTDKSHFFRFQISVDVLVFLNKEKIQVNIHTYVCTHVCLNRW